MHVGSMQLAHSVIKQRLTRDIICSAKDRVIQNCQPSRVICVKLLVNSKDTLEGKQNTWSRIAMTIYCRENLGQDVRKLPVLAILVCTLVCIVTKQSIFHSNEEWLHHLVWLRRH